MNDRQIRPGCEPFSFERGSVGVLMVHGFTGSPASMRPIGEWLASQDLSVEGVRLPGHGTDIDDLRARRWTEWVDEAARGLDALRERCRKIVTFAQSMGGCVALALAAERPHHLNGLALANPYVFDVRLLSLPLGGRFLKNAKGVVNDIAMPGQDELGYPRMPVPAVVEMSAMMKMVRAALPQIRLPVVVFRSGTDHVIPASNARKVLDRIGSEHKELVDCPNSYHVVSLDHDAPLVRERVLAFAHALDEDGAR